MSQLPRRSFTQGLVAGLNAAAAAQRTPNRPPNIIFICSDQHIGWYLGSEGHPIVRTPNLDRLARMGVRFRNAYCNSPLCAPARAALMSGLFPSDVNSYCNATAFDGRVPTWSNRLKDAGYHCWATGKLDIAHGVDYGFAAQQNTSFGHSEKPDIACLLRSPVCFLPTARERIDGAYVEKPHADVALFDRAIEYLRGERGKPGPLAMYLGPHSPHPNWSAQVKYRDIYPPDRMPLPVVPPGYFERRHTFFRIQANYRDVSVPIPAERVRRTRSAYFGMITELDAQIGRLLDELERMRQMENTVIIYTSDHGEMLGEHGLWSKNVLLENSARVPMILAGPGLARDKVMDTPVSHVDLVATVLDLAGAVKPPELRGHSLLHPESHPGFTYSETHSDGNCTGSFMIRKRNWKYIYFTADEPLLFDLSKDPGEFDNLAGKKESAAIRRELHGHLTSLVDPDDVTRRAFAEQARRLDALVGKLSRPEFVELVEDRLGPAQTQVLVDRLYGSKA